MDREFFKRTFIRLLEQRDWNITTEGLIFYFSELQSIPESRFEEVCRRIGCESDYLPKPQDFLDLSYQIGRAQISRMPALDDPNSAHARQYEETLSRMTPEERDRELAANRARLSALIEQLQRTMSKPSPDKGVPDLQQLNDWLKDPVLRSEAIVQLQSRIDLQPVFDDFGEIIGVKSN